MDLPSPVRAIRSRRWGAWVVVALGTALAVAAVEHFLIAAAEGRIVFAVLEISLLLGLAYGVAYAGYWLYHTEFDSEQVWRVAVWSVLGVIGTGAIGVWVFVNQFWQNQAIGNTLVFGIATLAAGAAGGVLVGIKEVRARAKAAEAARQREDLYVVNELLRHHVLNGAQVILGRSMTLEPHVDEEGADQLTAIRAQTERISELVEDLGTLTGALSGRTTTAPIDLPEMLREEVERCQSTYPNATFETTIDLPEGTEVVGDKALGSVFDHVFRNAVEHNDSDSPTVRVLAERSAGRVVIRIEDDGPGIPEDRREDLFDRGSHGEAGLGLYLVDALVTRYGGTVRVDDPEHLSGTAVVVELPERP